MRHFYAALASLLALSVSAQISPEADVRVQLFAGSSLSEVTVEPVSAPLTVTADGSSAGMLHLGARATLTRCGADVRARLGGAELLGRTIQISGGDFRLTMGRTSRRYTGSLVAVSHEGALRVVNHVPMTPYVASVVASEFNFREIEGCKAQAILARTYAARRAGAHAYHDLNDDHSSQVYRGMDTITETTRRAAEETAGQVLTYRGSLADAYYFSSSGGHTADNEAVWNGTPVPYLRGIPDPYDTAAPDHQWRTTASRSAVLRALSSQYGGRVTGVQLGRRSRSGRVLQVELIGGRHETITGAQFRRAVNGAVGGRTVRSTKFELHVEGDRFVFSGGGFGHGVGMSQYGALGQARAGRDYRDILLYYFQGTEVSGGAPGPAVLVAEGPRVSGSVSGAAVPREPSALRTRYRPASARRWPTPRHQARGASTWTDTAPGTGAPASVAPSESSADTAPAPRRRTAW